MQLICVFCFPYSEAQKRPHFIWVDNFSKFISRSIPTADRGVFSQCLWTGVSIFTLPEGTNDDISDGVKFDMNGNIIPAMPTDILQYRDDVVAAVHHVLTLGTQYLDIAAVTKYDVRNVPLKVDTNRFPNVADDVNSYKMNNVKSVDLIEDNIGSNRGLISIIDSICQQRNIHGDGQCAQYTTFNVDENIFWRILKVLSTY